jgi:PAS domain S-box-containing protein
MMKRMIKQKMKLLYRWNWPTFFCKSRSALRLSQAKILTLVLLVVGILIFTGEAQAAVSSSHRLAGLPVNRTLFNISGISILLLFAALFSLRPKRTAQPGANRQELLPNEQTAEIERLNEKCRLLEAEFQALTDNLSPKEQSGEVELLHEKYRLLEDRFQALTDTHQLFFENHPLPMSVYDTKTLTFLAANAAAIRLYGYAREEFRSLRLGDIQLTEESSKDAADPTTRRLAKHRKQDGTILDVEVGFQELSVDGKPVTLVTIFDVSKWHRAAEAWDQERQLLQSLMDQLPVFIYAKDRESRFVFGNLAVASSKGEKSSQDLIGKSDFDYYPPELATEYRATEEAIMSSGKGVSDLEVYERDKNGNESWFLNARVPWVDRNGKVVGILGVNREITERKRAEGAIKESEALFNSLFNSLPQKIYCKDRDGKLSFGNAAFCDAIGLTLDDIAGKTEFDIFPEELARQHEPEDARVIAGEVLDIIEIHETATGEKRYRQMVKTPRYDSKGEIVGLQAIFWDITERKQSEEALEKSLTELQTIVSAVSEGDLTKRAVEDETAFGRIAQSVNKMLDKFSKMILQVKGLGLMVSSSAIQILAASEEIKIGLQRQADEITSTSISVEEMAASMTQVSRNAATTTDSAHQALDMAQQGDGATRNTLEAMERIDATAQLTAVKMRTLAQRSSEISEILDMINDVASQTNLLSLNAAIQAAHAGEAGLGFSVVAKEIRKLAERSAQSTKDIGSLIKTIQAETSEALTSMELAMTEVRKGSQLAKVAGQSIQDISDVVTQSANLVEEISVAAEEQARVSHSIAEAMQTVSSIATQTSTGTHQSSKIMYELVNAAENLSEAMLKFKIGEELTR